MLNTKQLLWFTVLVKLTLPDEHAGLHESLSDKINYSQEGLTSIKKINYGTVRDLESSLLTRKYISQTQKDDLSVSYQESDLEATKTYKTRVPLTDNIINSNEEIEHSSSSITLKMISRYKSASITLKPESKVQASIQFNTEIQEEHGVSSELELKESLIPKKSSKFSEIQVPKVSESHHSKQLRSDSDISFLTSFESSLDPFPSALVNAEAKMKEINTTEAIEEETNTSKLLVHSGNLTVPLRNIEQFNNYTGFGESILFSDDLETESEPSPAQFLSFEDWKKAKGVESEKYTDPFPHSRPQTKPNTDNGVIGEEMEIDFSNFFGASEQEPEGKLYQDRFNFASFDCSATIVKTNSEAKSATSILFEDKESYLLNPCSAPNKFVTIELCQDILIDSVVVGNFEFFSSTFKKISISVSEIFPVPKNGWKNLGIFEAKDVRNFQAFNIENPMIWAKYFRIEILEHYGEEYYCPLSVVRVHGRTMIQEYKQEKSKQQNKKLDILRKVASEAQRAEESTSISSSDSCRVKEVCVANKTSRNSNNTTGDLSRENLTNSSFSDLNECATILPMLKFEEFFKQFNNKVECEEPKTSTTAIHKAISSVGTQESIYKNIMKRLSLLESNATLSVLYIEEQSKLLSQAFASLEKKQSQKLNQLTANFSNNVIGQIKALQELYNVFQQQAEKYFLSEKMNHDSMLKTVYERMGSLQNELKFQKFVSFINFFIMFSVLIYVFITKDTYIDTEYVENDKICLDEQNQTITSTSSGLKTNVTNFTKHYYNSDVESGESDTNSGTEDYRDLTAPIPSLSEIDSKNVKKLIDECVKTRPITPNNSDDEL